MCDSFIEKGLLPNYMAILCSIISDTPPSVSIKSIILHDPSVEKKHHKSSKRVPITLIDILNKKSKDFESVTGVANYLNINTGVVSVYVKSEKTYKKQYKFKLKGVL